MLCEACEEQFGNYEKYMKEALYCGRHGIDIQFYPTKVEIHGLDYRKAKYYYLSVMWRMSVSSLPFFSSVSLGPHENKIREILKNELDSPPEIYPMGAVWPTVEGQFRVDRILEPGKIKIGPHYSYRFIMGGILYFFMTNKSAIQHEFVGELLPATGVWTIPVIDEMKIEFLKRWIIENMK